MTKAVATETEHRQVTLLIYDGAELRGGGAPFGRIRTFQVELLEGDQYLVRRSLAGRQLQNLVTSQGKAIGKPIPLPWDATYRSASKQKFLLPISLTLEVIKEMIPFDPHEY